MMSEPPFELGPIRPPAEARSLLIRTTRGCPWNRCDFCTNYRQMRFSLRSVEEIKEDIRRAARYYHGYPFQSCFLQDGDSFIMLTDQLVEVLRFLKEQFPSLERVSSYGRAHTMVRKSLEEMREICQAGLNRLYCGLESGSDEVLTYIHKGATAADMIRAGQMAREAGMEVSEFVIMGIGGRKLWRVHAVETARVLNAIDPHFIRVRSLGVKEGSPLEDKVYRGEFEIPSEEEIIVEQRLLLEGLDGIGSYYSNDHSVNLLMEVEGRLPDDKPAMLATLDRYLALSPAEKTHFAVGRRLGDYARLDDMHDVSLRQRVEQKQVELTFRYPGQLEEIFHYVRSQII